MNKAIPFLIFLFTSIFTQAQTTTYWQQRADYTMSIDMNVKNYQYTGTQHLVYTNNSPDTLDFIFYHLYFNAFQPGSDMDVRLHHITDPDGRMVNKQGTKEKPIYESRIAKLKPNEIGFIKINTLQQDGKNLNYELIGTLLKVKLNHALKPGEKTDLDMTFTGQVPVQIRRSGRNNKEGIALSMTQWYPKIATYDFEGWHANQYIAREFFADWGRYDLKITIDKKYTIGGTGILQNPNKIGHGYETEKVKKSRKKKQTWHFIAENVHDFTWVADPDFIHDTLKTKNDITLHFFYKKSLDKEYLKNWKEFQPKVADLLSFYSKNIGDYPFKQYSVIQGGDGGMEYAMCTLITGERKLASLIGVTAHEFAHTWFQFLLASNEIKHEWMDEGFTSYISDLAMHTIMQQDNENPFERAFQGYTYLAKSGVEEPQSVYADRFAYNLAYGASAYNKGEVFLAQLSYIIGEKNLQQTLLQYFKDFAFKHPSPNDFIRTAEKISGLQLHWYLNEWTQTTHTIDYTIQTVLENKITLENKGSLPMPIDLTVTYIDDSTENFYIPLATLLGSKPTTATKLKSWSWVSPIYNLETTKKIKSVEIDPKGLMADIDRSNNSFGLDN